MRRLLLLALLSTAGACVSTNATILNPSPVKRAVVQPDQVRIYRTAAQVVGKYEEVALLNSTGSTGFTSEAVMMKSMRKKAADVGANGIIMGNIDEPGAGAKVAAAVFGTSTQRKGKSVAIFVPSDSARASAFCASSKVGM